MDDQAQRAMMFRIIGAYIELSLFTAQRQLLTSRNPQQWMVDKSFGSIVQNAPQFIAQANAPVPQMQAFNMNQAQGLLQQVTQAAPQQTQGPPIPPAPGHWEWEDTTQGYTKWVANP